MLLTRQVLSTAGCNPVKRNEVLQHNGRTTAMFGTFLIGRNAHPRVSTRAQSEVAVDARTQEYNQQMQKAMEWNDPYKYYFDRGLYFHEVSENLVCGTQPRNPAEVEELAAEHGVSAIVNLQQDKDFHYWGVDFEANKDKCQQLGVKIHRVPVRYLGL